MKMKTQRKGSSLTKADKLARKKLIKSTFILSSLVALLFVFLISRGTDGGLIGFILVYPFGSIYTLILWLAVTIFYWLVAKPGYIQKAYDKISADISKTLAERMLIPGKLTKMDRIYTKDYRDFFIGLAEDKEAEFYAKLGEKDQLIELFVQLKGSKKLRSLGVITKEEFTSYCEISED